MEYQADPVALHVALVHPQSGALEGGDRLRLGVGEDAGAGADVEDGPAGEVEPRHGLEGLLRRRMKTGPERQAGIELDDEPPVGRHVDPRRLHQETPDDERTVVLAPGLEPVSLDERPHLELAHRCEPEYREPAEGRLHSSHADARGVVDRKSTRLNSSHRTISYAVFCLKKK